MFDLAAVNFLQSYNAKPGHFFSGFGALVFVGGLAAVLFAALTGPLGRFNVGLDLLPWIGLGGVGLGIILISFGFVTELMLFVSKNPAVAVVRVHEKPRK